MTSVIRNPRDFWAGVVFVAAGVAFILMSRNFTFGTAWRMGPGYFPTVLASLLVLVGLGVGVRGLKRSGAPIEPVAVRAAVMLVLAVLAFGLMVRTTGMMIASMALVVLAALARREFDWRETALLALGLGAFSALVFVHGLGIPLPAFLPNFGG